MAILVLLDFLMYDYQKERLADVILRLWNFLAERKRNPFFLSKRLNRNVTWAAYGGGAIVASGIVIFFGPPLYIGIGLFIFIVLVSADAISGAVMISAAVLWLFLVCMEFLVRR